MQGQTRRFRIEGGHGGSMPTLRREGSSPASGSALPGPAEDLSPHRRVATPRHDASHVVEDLRRDLHAMKHAIAATKREVSALQTSPTGGGIHRAAGELDAVADATERATTAILGAAEEIETAANMLRAAGLEGGRSDYVGTILDRVVLLYETCNFQDLTGQRIQKVVTTLKFVESRLDAVIGAWGVTEPMPVAVVSEVDSGADLLSGPPVAGETRISQVDVDAIFT